METLDLEALELALKTQDWNEEPFMTKLKTEVLRPIYNTMYGKLETLPMTMDRKFHEVQFLGIQIANFANKVYVFEITTPKEAHAYIYYAPRKDLLWHKSGARDYLYFSLSKTLYTKFNYISDEDRCFGMNIAAELRKVL